VFDEACANSREVQRLGYYLPWFLAAATFGSVGFGLLSTLSAHTSTAKWIGYLILNGVARGMGTAMVSLSTP
jgi:hypothetical protein